MTITYQDYDYEAQTINIKLDTGGILKANMEYDLLSCGAIEEIEFLDDTLKDLFFKIGGQTYSAAQVVLWCHDEHDDIRFSEWAEGQDNDAMALELSCAKLSGRI